MTTKKLTAAILSVAAVMSIVSIQAFAAALTAQQAKAIAEKLVPSGSAYVTTEVDDGRYEVKFYNQAKLEKYEIDVGRATQKAISFDSELLDDRGARTATLTQEQAKKVVTDEHPGATIQSVTVDYDDGLMEYDVRFTASGYYGEITVHPGTGAVLKRDIQIGTQPTANDVRTLISYTQATEAALKQVPGGVITDVDLDREGGTYIYEIEVYKDGLEYDVALNAADGTVLWSNSHADSWSSFLRANPASTPAASSNASAAASSRSSTPAATPSMPSGNNGYIGFEKAKQIAMAQAPGAVVRKCEMDFDDGRMKYEVELRNGFWEYDFDIDAVTGAIIKWDQDYDD